MGGTRRSRREGSVAIEFALVGPLFVLLLMGAVVYGGWLWMAQGVQHLASEGARASVAGLDPAERALLARQTVAEDAGRTTILTTADVSVAVASDERAVAVTVSYDARRHPLMALAGLIPAPPLVITRQATVRVGGYR